MEKVGKSAVAVEHDGYDDRPEKPTAKGVAVLPAIVATWRVPVVATLVLLVLSVAGLTITRAFLPRTTTFVSQFHFTFRRWRRVGTRMGCRFPSTS